MYGDILYLGLPITLFIISLGAYIFVGLEIKKKRIDIKDIVAWLLLNTIFTAVIIYILIVSIVQHFHPHVTNIFNWVAQNAFGLKLNNQEWIIIMILSLIAFILVLLMVSSVRIQRIQKRMDDMAKEVAILNGKVNKTVNYDNFEVAKNKVSARDVKRDLREKVKIAKAKRKAEQKIKLLTQTHSISLDKKDKKK